MDEMKYEQVLKELEDIASKLQSGDIGVDDLVAQVKRAKELIKICSDKLTRADGEVKELIASEAEGN